MPPEHVIVYVIITEQTALYCETLGFLPYPFFPPSMKIFRKRQGREMNISEHLI